MIRFVFTLICVSLFWPIHSVAEDSGKKLQASLDQLDSLSGHFSQSKFEPSTGQSTIQSSGTMSLQRPGLFRWHYDTPYEQIIVADGENVWFYDIDLEQVSVRDAASSLIGSPAQVLVGAEAITDQFHVLQLASEDQITWYQLTPKIKDGSYSEIQLGLTDGHISVLKMEDEFGRNMKLEFTAVKINPKLDPTLFTFTPPDGVDVVGQAQ